MNRFTLSKLQILISPFNRKLSKQNAGIGRRVKMLSQDKPDITSRDIDEEALENLESDFMNAREIQEFHTREVSKIQKKIEFKRVERKYFERTKLPNMLTWSEKEQIRQLFNSEPEIWTVQKLSESFPATVLVIQKVLNSQWVPDSLERILKHDQSVASNWKKFKLGKFNISDEALVKHLKKFTSRQTLFHHNKDALTVLEKPVQQTSTKAQEFSSIITDYNAKNGEEKREEKPVLFDGTSLPKVKDIESDTFVLADAGRSRKSKRLYTLEELRKEVRSSPHTRVNSQDELLSAGSGKDAALPITRTSEEEVLLQVKLDVLHSDVAKRRTEDKSPVESTDTYPDKITIPREKWKEGSIYKVSDCFYDCDGEFLYRVPGMIK